MTFILRQLAPSIEPPRGGYRPGYGHRTPRITEIILKQGGHKSRSTNACATLSCHRLRPGCHAGVGLRETLQGHLFRVKMATECQRPRENTGLICGSTFASETGAQEMLRAVLSVFIFGVTLPAAAQGPRQFVDQPASSTPRVAAARPNLLQASGPGVVLSTTNWTPLGPAPLSTTNGNGNVSGRIVGIAAHPTNPN